MKHKGCYGWPLSHKPGRRVMKGRLGDQRGGSEWEPIKNLLQRENLAYAPNSQPQIPTRVCQGSVVTADLPTLGANPKWSQSESETQGAKDWATQHWTRRTVCKHRADRLRGLGGLSADTGRTFHEAKGDCPRGCDGPSENNPRTSSTAPSITDPPRWARGPSAPSHTIRHSSRIVREHLATKIHRQNGSNEKHARTREEHNELLAESHLADRPLGARGLFAWSADSSPNSTS
jgi:hypothetical protein